MLQECSSLLLLLLLLLIFTDDKGPFDDAVTERRRGLRLETRHTKRRCLDPKAALVPTRRGVECFNFPPPRVRSPFPGRFLACSVSGRWLSPLVHGGWEITLSRFQQLHTPGLYLLFPLMFPSVPPLFFLLSFSAVNSRYSPIHTQTKTWLCSPPLDLKVFLSVASSFLLFLPRISRVIPVRPAPSLSRHKRG